MTTASVRFSATRCSSQGRAYEICSFLRVDRNTLVSVRKQPLDIDPGRALRSGELDAVFTTSQALTRELLQDGMSKLKDTLNQMGMDVASFQVGDGQTQQRGGESTPGQMSKSTNTGKTESTPVPPPTVNAPRLKMGQDGWDVLV